MNRILQITPHRVFPPRGGRRAFFFQRELARQNEVELVVPQALNSFVGTKEGYTMPADVSIHSSVDSPAKNVLFGNLSPRLSKALRFRVIRRSLHGPASAEVLDNWHLVQKILTDKEIDVVILDHIQTLSLARPIARISPSTIRMLNAHNVDYVLYERLAAGEVEPQKKAEWLRRAMRAKMIEQSLHRTVHGYWACSEGDHEELQRLNAAKLPGFAIPNGIAPEVLPFDNRTNKRQDQKILFCGSLNYEPNIRGLRWFEQKVWPIIKSRLPQAQLTVIGYGADPHEFAGLRSDPSVDFVGEVEDVVPWYHKTSISIVPLFEGSGTRVKILEAMTLGNPVISTTIGAEGIDVANNREISLADDANRFADCVERALSNEELYNALREAGRKLVDERYDWKVVGKKLNDTLDQISSSVKGKRL